ncbi:MAG: hypothetical protein FWG28_02530 [Clostridiales bacterium]|nr:hypothetical protein [Clostridiales bacterium]
MEGFQDKAEGAPRRQGGAGKKHRDKDNRKPEPSGEAGDRKNNTNFHRKKKSVDRETREERELWYELEPESEPEAKPAPRPEGPPSFHAHALDLEPGVVFPERPSLDLTYVDFTRESYEADKPFVPRKKKIVPFELSETPRMQPDFWEGRTPGRRKLMGQPDGANRGEKDGEAARTRDGKPSEGRKEARDKSGDKKETGQRAQKGRGERKAARDGARDNTRDGASESIVESARENTRESAGEGVRDGSKEEAQEAGRQSRGNIKRQDQPMMKRSAKRQEHNADRRKSRDGGNTGEGKSQPAEPANDQGGGDAKESLIKPYWMKK